MTDKVKPGAAAAAHGLRGRTDLAGRQINPRDNAAVIRTQAVRVISPILAEITGSNSCEAEGWIGRGAAPVPALCRLLIAAGFDPNRALHAYRGATLCIIVTSIGAAARLTVDETRTAFARWKPFPRAAGSPQIGPSEPAATSHPSWAPRRDPWHVTVDCKNVGVVGTHEAAEALVKKTAAVNRRGR
jgi:hypothetical protein